MKKFIVFFLFFVSIFDFLSAKGFSDSGHIASSKKHDNDLIHVEARGTGIFFDRSSDFQIANTGDWAASIAAQQNGNESQLSYGMNKWGGGYGIDVLLPNKGLAGMQFSFDQCFMSGKQNDLVPGIGAGLLTSMAFIDGKAHGPSNTYGFYISAATLGGSNSPGEVNLKYTLNHYMISLAAVCNLWNQDSIAVDLFVGPSYAVFLQEYLFKTRGNEPTSATETTSSTKEQLNDYLFGGEIGFKGKMDIWKGFFLSLKQDFGLFARHSRFYGRQDIVNGGGMSPAGAFTGLNALIRTRDFDTDFTSRFTSNAAFGYDLADWISIKIFYEFDMWLNLTRIDNIVVSSDLIRQSSDATRIRGDDLRSSMIGGSAVIKF